MVILETILPPTSGYLSDTATATPKLPLLGQLLWSTMTHKYLGNTPDYPLDQIINPWNANIREMKLRTKQQLLMAMGDSPCAGDSFPPCNSGSSWDCWPSHGRCWGGATKHWMARIACWDTFRQSLVITPVMVVDSIIYTSWHQERIRSWEGQQE